MLDKDSRINNFEEKPLVPRSNLVSTCIYFFPKEKLSLIDKYLKFGNNRDTPGSYLSWLTKNDRVYGKIFDGLWFDLGDFYSLSEAVIQMNGHFVA
jgi:NDP-sugar pyrophosphorylase family protein